MLKIKEEDLGFFQITNKNQLSPGDIMTFLVEFLHTLHYQCFLLFLGVLQLGWEAYPNSF